jgi:hypothetical protein
MQHVWALWNNTGLCLDGYGMQTAICASSKLWWRSFLSVIMSLNWFCLCGHSGRSAHGNFPLYTIFYLLVWHLVPDPEPPPKDVMDRWCYTSCHGAQLREEFLGTSVRPHAWTACWGETLATTLTQRVHVVGTPLNETPSGFVVVVQKIKNYKPVRTATCSI